MRKTQDQQNPLVRTIRHAIIGRLGTPLLVALMGLALTANTAKASDFISVGPYVQNVQSESIVVMWQTATAMGSHVAYWSDDQGMQLVTDPNLRTQHEIQLNSLAPDTAYQYLILSDTNDVFEGRCHTAPNQARSLRLVVYGDSRSQPDAHNSVIKAILRNEPEIVLHTGDLVNIGEKQESWVPEFFEPARELIQHTPVFPILGNHEYWHSGRSWFSSFFCLPNNEQWFAFSYGNVRIIGLDTNVSFFPGSVQYRWLEAELKSEAYQKSMWRIAYFHHPPFTASRYSDDPDINQYLLPLFEASGVDMVFSGHAHAYERYAHHGIQYIVTGGGGTHVVSLVEDTEPPIRLVGRSLLHHCVLDVNVPDRSLTMSAQKNDGTAFDELTLVKSAPDPNSN